MIKDDAWLLWGEQGDRLQDPSPASTGTSTASAEGDGAVATVEATVARHPFAASREALRNALDGVLADDRMKVAEDVVLRLPHDRNENTETPVPGLALATRLAIDTPDTEDLHLAETVVPCIEIDASTAVELFPRIAERAPDDLVVGHDIRFWSEVATFAIELLVDQRFVPSVIQVEGGPLRGRWVPWLADGELAEPLRHLATGMPSVAIATTDFATSDRWTAIESALEAMVDALVRQTLVGEDYLEAIEDRDPEADHQVAMLGGLLGSGRDTGTSRETNVDVSRGMRLWLGGLIDPVEGRAVRLCLQLTEPLEGVLDASPEDIEKALWPLGFHLLVTDDPPIIVDADDIWADGGGGRLASV
ncbi:MAG: hypothetical protein GY921_01550, partial [Phycisphaeraceae bacterium]|nr:hypothetical protein [Phycisphaeraceae bacterium]